MAQVLIRNIPDDVVERFKTRARLKGVSLEQTLRDGEPSSSRAKLLLQAGLELVAPDLVLLEIANALWKN